MDVAWGDWQAWGETDGMYRNPIVPADYSDLDCIRVGDDYYAISSTMQFSPGMTILHSRDLVNWEIAGHAVYDLGEIGNAMTWKEMDRYGRGIWAGSLRYHDGRFHVFFGTPDEGYFMTSAERAEGPWEPLTCLLAEDGWDDCTAIWDKRGRGYFLGTSFKDGYKTYMFDMAADGKSIDKRSARLLNEGNGREASKLIYHDGYYYIIFSEHRDGIGRYVMAKRDKKLSGKFKEEKQLLLPCREANEPNQGGIVEGKDGRWYFLTHHGSGDWSGRVMSLLPVEWVDGWPMMGDRSLGETGTMVWQGAMPIEKGKHETGNEECLKLGLQRSDDFDATQLGPQWQWNYEPRKEMFSLSERPGWMRLKAFRPLKQGIFLTAGNTLTQRSFRTQHNEVTVKLDISHATDGLHAGLVHFASHSASIGIANRKGQNYLEFTHDDDRQQGIAIPSNQLWLKSVWGLDGKSTFYYSLDGDHFVEFGQYQLSWGYYRGDRIGVFCFNDLSESGFMDVDYLHYGQEGK
ncbi:MAG: glycoside hydrolase 43 family protein [Prevotella sp.]|nr:glycoside hydrolase 43 family protein [Prevotella sp.]